jgi:hypothetical protein
MFKIGSNGFLIQVSWHSCEWNKKNCGVHVFTWQKEKKSLIFDLKCLTFDALFCSLCVLTQQGHIRNFKLEMNQNKNVLAQIGLLYDKNCWPFPKSRWVKTTKHFVTELNFFGT